MPTLRAPSSILLPDGSQLPCHLILSGRSGSDRPTYVGLQIDLPFGGQNDFAITDITDAMPLADWARRVGGYFDEQE